MIATSFVQTLQDRIKQLQANLAAEEKSKNKSPLYIHDLRDTIASCQKQIEAINRNPASALVGPTLEPTKELGNEDGRNNL